MCLGVPGRIVSIIDEQGIRMGEVDFGAVARNVCLAYVPEATIDDYVIVHAGFAISTVDANEAARTLDLIGELDDRLGAPKEEDP